MRLNDRISINTISGDSHRRLKTYRILRICFCAAFIIFTLFFVNEVFIQPYRSNKVILEIQKLYPNVQNTSSTSGAIGGVSLNPINQEGVDDIPISYPDRDSQGRLMRFNGLLKINGDVKGWLTIPETNIYYPVLQSTADDPEFYLRRNIYKESDKQGSLFIDINSSIDKEPQNMVIYGHNMTSTGTMFHQLVEYKSMDFYKKRPVITFDSLYQTGKWKIIAVFITNGGSKYEKFFDYTRSAFKDHSDFLNFVYQLRVRSLYNINVDVTENDQLLTLSTCSYEMENYRTVVAARKIRDGESTDVDVAGTDKNNPLYPQTWYENYGGTPPEVSSFEEALKAGEINWYKSAGS